MNHSCPKPPQTAGVCIFLEEKNVTNTEKEKKSVTNYGYGSAQQREKKSEKWNFIGRFGQEIHCFGTMRCLPEMAK